MVIDIAFLIKGLHEFFMVIYEVFAIIAGIKIFRRSSDNTVMN
jgi:hypothetical protein